MKTNRRQFVKGNLFGGLAAALPVSTFGADAPRSGSGSQNPRYTKLDEILKQPVLKRGLFTSPVIIASLELLRLNDSFLCRVRSRDGAEGLAVGHSGLKALHPIFQQNLQPFFLGKDARNLDLLMEKVFIYGFNFRYSGISIGIPLATIEFAILDMLGHIANQPIGRLIGEIHHPEVAVYQATEYRYGFFEEPVMFDWYEETRQVAEALSLPIAGGEQEYSLHGFRWLIAYDALQIVQPDNYYFGGMIRSMKVARMAEAFGKPCTPHMSGGGLGFLYMMHFVSALPNAMPHHEFKGLGTSVRFACDTSPLKVVDGKIKVPTGPGLGVDFDPGFVSQHRLVGG